MLVDLETTEEKGTLASGVEYTFWTFGGTVLEMKLEVPGRFLVVDHSISRAMDKGALGAIMVTGDARPDLFRALTPDIARRASGH